MEPQDFSASIAELLLALESLSRSRPDRLLRLWGQLPVNAMGDPDGTGQSLEPFELLIYRGFSSSTTHPTAFDPDRPALPEGSRIESAELLEGPLDPAAARVLAGPVVATDFLRIENWG
jgi:hypothetical protein